MANIWKRLLSAGSQTSPRIADDIIESKALQQKLAEEAAEEAPEVLGKGTSRMSREASEEVPDAMWREITPEPKKITDLDTIIKMAKENPKTAAALTTIMGGSLANQFMGGQEPPTTKVPFAPEPQMPAAEPVKPEELQAKQTVKTEAPKEGGLDFDALSKKFDENMSALPKEEAPVVDEMAEAQSRSDNNMLMALLGKAASQIGSGIATVGAGREVKTDTSGFDDLLKLADRPVSQLKERSAYDKAKSEINDEKAMRDPNSEISRLMSEVAAKAGLIKPGTSMSAMALKNSGINLGNLLATIEAGKARKEAAQTAKDSKDAAKTEKLSQDQRKFVQALRKEATTGVLGKQYATFATAQRMNSALDEFSKNPSGYSDYATLMGGLKALQGDESVVREAEVRLGMSATSAINAALNYLQRAATGQSLQPEQRAEMIKTISTLSNSAKTQYMHSVQPILEQAEMEGIDPNLILSGSLSSIKKEQPESTVSEAQTKEFKQQLPPGSTVTTKSGKKYKIGADGRTGTLVQ